jgi:hypothetical protein
MLLVQSMLLVQASAEDVLTQATAEAAAVLARLGGDAPPVIDAQSAPDTPPRDLGPTGDAVLTHLEDRIDAIRAKLSGREAVVEEPDPLGEHDGPRRADVLEPASDERRAPDADRADERHAPEADRADEPRPTDKREHAGEEVSPDGTPAWVRRALATPESDIDYFAELRQALEDGEPLGPRDEHGHPNQNGSRHLGPMLRGMPILVTLTALSGALALRPF